MPATVEMFLAAQTLFDERLPSAGSDAWSAPTPAGEWRVWQLAVHMVIEHRWAAVVLGAGSKQEADRAAVAPPAAYGADVLATWRGAAAQTAAAVQAPIMDELAVELPSGIKAASGYVDELTVDAFIHAWDLDAALRDETRMPMRLVEWVYRTVGSWDPWTWSQMFERPVTEPDEEQLLNRIIAAAGRDPHSPGATS